MKLATENLRIPGLNERTVADFRNVRNVKQLKATIVDNYVTICKDCASHSFCKFHDASEPPCPILEKVVHNYVDMNIKSVDTENQHCLSEFIRSVILLTQIFEYFENWRCIYVDEGFNWYYESAHPRLNSLYGLDLLVNISKYLRAYKVVETERLKRIAVLVEGRSEHEALPPIFEALGVFSGTKNSVKFYDLGGKDRAKKDKIKQILRRFKEDEVSYYLILDDDVGVERDVQDLKREGILEDGNYTIWKGKFEDNFGEEAILRVLKEANEVFSKIDVDELKRYNSTKHDIAKSIEHIAKEKEIQLRFDDYKVGIARRLSEWICREIDESMRTKSGTYNGRRTPKSKSFPEFLKEVRRITETIRRTSSEFHVVNK